MKLLTNDIDDRIQIYRLFLHTINSVSSVDY